MYSDRPIPLETILTDFEDFNHTDTDTDFKDEITYQCRYQLYQLLVYPYECKLHIMIVVIAEF